MFLEVIDDLLQASLTHSLFVSFPDSNDVSHASRADSQTSIVDHAWLSASVPMDAARQLHLPFRTSTQVDINIPPVLCHGSVHTSKLRG